MQPPHDKRFTLLHASVWHLSRGRSLLLFVIAVIDVHGVGVFRHHRPAKGKATQEGAVVESRDEEEPEPSPSAPEGPQPPALLTTGLLEGGIVDRTNVTSAEALSALQVTGGPCNAAEVGGGCNGTVSVPLVDTIGTIGGGPAKPGEEDVVLVSDRPAVGGASGVSALLQASGVLRRGPALNESEPRGLHYFFKDGTCEGGRVLLQGDADEKKATSYEETGRRTGTSSVQEVVD